MSICNRCEQWVGDALTIRDSGQLDELKVYYTHYIWPARGYDLEFDHVAKTRYSCWFCARVWSLARLVGKGSSHQGMLLTETEIWEMIKGECSCETKHIHIMASFFHLDGYQGYEVMRVSFNLHEPSTQWPCPPFFELDLLNSDYSEARLRSRQFPRTYVYEATKERGQDKCGDEEASGQVVEQGDSSEQETQSTLRYLLELVDKPEGPEDEPPTSSDRETLSFPEGRIDQIRRWIADCDENHNCSHQKSYVPTRLIHIGDGGKLRLVETAQCLTEGMQKYATLSYCWGIESFDTLTLATYSSALNEIELSYEDRTFEQFVQLCRQVDIEYIWIDSWCIIQDSREDWLEEAPRMHQVYGNSHLTIASVASKGGKDSLIWPMQYPLVTSIFINLPDGNRLHGGAHAGLLGDEAAHNRTLFGASPLFTRGWAVQEMYLSPRILYCTDVQLYWKCQDKFFHENPPNEMRQGDIWPYTYWNQLRPGLRAPLVDRRWTVLVENFSHTSVTMREDRTMALSGIAARISETYAFCGIETTFIGGCWVHNLQYWLMWLNQGPLGKFKKSGRYQHLPTWTWLSHPGHVALAARDSMLWGHSITYLADVKGIEAAPLDPRIEFGFLAKAELTLSAPRLFIESISDLSVPLGPLQGLEKQFAPSNFGWSSSLLQITNSIGETIRVNFGVSSESGENLKELQVSLQMDYDGEDDPWPSQLECLPIGNVEKGSENPYEKRINTWFGMIVQQQPDSHLYHRIGFFFLDYQCSGGEDKIIGPAFKSFFRLEDQLFHEYVLE